MKIKAKAIFFDFDNTLGDRYRYVYDGLCYLVKTRLPEVDPDSMLFEAMVQDLVIIDQFGCVGSKYVFSAFEEKYHVSLGVEDPVAWWHSNLYNFTCLFDDTIDTLKVLKEKGFKLGIITNGYPGPQRGKIEVTGIAPYFDSIIISKEFGVNKPDPAIFQGASASLGLKPEECVYVGDIFSNDIMGAYNAGFTPVWMYPDEKTRYSARKDVIRINKLSELLEMCECTE